MGRRQLQHFPEALNVKDGSCLGRRTSIILKGDQIRTISINLDLIYPNEFREDYEIHFFFK